MSKYTTQLRHICEAWARSEGKDPEALTLDDLIAVGTRHIFPFDFPTPLSERKNIIAAKAVRRYYMDEIGAETPALWQLRLHALMDAILPSVNEVYKSTVIRFDPLTVSTYQKELTSNTAGSDLSVTHQSTDLTGTGSTSGSTTGSGNDTRTGGTTGTSTTTTKTSDTPQGGLTGLQNNNYLTQASITDTTDGTTTSDSVTSSTSSTSSGTTSSTEHTTTAGNQDSTHNSHMVGTENYTATGNAIEQIAALRKLIVDCDKAIVDSMEPLFFGLWD